MKRILTLILSLTLAACLSIPTGEDTSAAIVQPATRIPTPHPTQEPTATATDAPKVCAVTAEALHVRSGPGITNPVTGYLYAGDVVTVINQRGAWYEIGDGWIHSRYCEVKP